MDAQLCPGQPFPSSPLFTPPAYLFGRGAVRFSGCIVYPSDPKTYLGAEFQVNSYTSSNQGDPAVATASDGDFVVVWRNAGSTATDSSNYSVQGQRYASDGSVLGGEFQVNSYTTDYQKDPAVGMVSDGDFVVVWTSGGSGGTDPSSPSVQGQRFLGPHWIFTDGFESGDTSAW